MKDSYGRKVIDVEFDFNSDGSAFVIRAWYDDDSSPVPDEELEYLTDTYPEVLSDAELNRAIGIADFMHE